MFQTTQSKFQKGRLVFLVMTICLFWFALEVNLFHLQVINHDKFERIANNQYIKNIEIPAQRGTIFDRNGNVMATNVIHYDLAADPKMVENKNVLARKCSEAFGNSVDYYLRRLNRKTNFIYLARRAPENEVTSILNLEDHGLIKGKNFRRFYPYNSYAAHLLGFTDTDDNGISGLEKQYQKELEGKNGIAVLQYDGPRRISYNPDKPLVWPKRGKNIYLTIDKNIQTIVEQELAAGVKKCRGKAGMAVVMDPNTGEILAMANYPQFNVNRQNDYPSDIKRNRTITDVFEPGSTMKIFSSAALLQERAKSRNDIVFCENGRYRLAGHTFTDTKAHAWLSFMGVVEKSSNIGMIKLIESISSATLYKYLLNFGFGSETNIGLEGEEAGILNNYKTWSGISKNSISIGYEISVTAMQLTAAYAAIINGGYLNRPYVVSHFEDENNRVYDVQQPEMVRQIISKEVSNELKEFMLNVVEHGTGQNAQIKNLQIGGKTGTARKLDKNTGTYSTRKYNSSFVGFAPFKEPKYLCTVVVDESHTSSYGGTVAAPIFRHIMYRIVHLNPDAMHQDDREEDYQPQLAMIKDLPDLSGFEVENAVALLDAKDIDYEVSGRGPVISKVSLKDETLHLNKGQNRIEMNRIPNLKGLTLREATAKLDLSKIRLLIEGTGRVIKQSINPGTPIQRRTQLILTCK
ncbi:MAG: penicillin-binding transpeptidase domain-containing protein [Calditrichaceae bacterium]